MKGRQGRKGENLRREPAWLDHQLKCLFDWHRRFEAESKYPESSSLDVVIRQKMADFRGGAVDPMEQIWPKYTAIGKESPRTRTSRVLHGGMTRDLIPAQRAFDELHRLQKQVVLAEYWLIHDSTGRYYSSHRRARECGIAWATYVRRFNSGMDAMARHWSAYWSAENG